jgi:hydrogenase expression/formation protein HypD
LQHLSEYRDVQRCRQLAAAVKTTASRPWQIMEICGGQTHAIMKYSLQELIAPAVSLLHGPGCPACVTPAEKIDQAVNLAGQATVTLFTYGDMLRIPGNGSSLLQAKARGADVRAVYSPMDALAFAEKNPHRDVIFFAIGFETTTVPNALTVLQADHLGLKNFSLLVSQVLVPPAIDLILSQQGHGVQGFLAAGHVCTVSGYGEYHALSEKHRVPIVITGFEPFDILKGIQTCVVALEEGRHEVFNEYARWVREDGNQAARNAVETVFTRTDMEWRGIGNIPASGLRLSDKYRHFDAAVRHFGPATPAACTPASPCRAGEILTGRLRPDQCPAFGGRCTPDMPLGAPMVSGEGACAAYFRYRAKQPEKTSMPVAERTMS